MVSNLSNFDFEVDFLVFRRLIFCEFVWLEIKMKLILRGRVWDKFNCDGCVKELMFFVNWSGW